MENFIKNPGLQHIALNIFCNLDLETLKICKQINQFSDQLLDFENPFFWLQKFIQRGLPKEHQRDWTKAIKITKGTVLEKYVCSYLKNCTKNKRVVDLPSDWARVPGSGLKPGFFPFERVGFFNLKTRVPGFPIF